MAEFKKIKISIAEIALLLSIICVFNLGHDLTLHLHNSWLLSEMIETGSFSFYDKYMALGKQLTFNYGLISYFTSGIIFPIFKERTIDIIEAVLLFLEYLLLKKWFKSNRLIAFNLIFLTSAVVIADSYTAIFSNFFFFISLFGYFNKKKWWNLPLFISVINHPFNVISSFYFLFRKEKKSFYPILAGIIYHGIIFLAVRNLTSLPFYMPFIIISRVFLNLSPVILGFLFDEVKENSLKILKKINFRTPAIMSTVLTGIFMYMIIVPALSVDPPKNEMLDENFLNGIPKIEGIINIIDYISFPGYYWLHQENLTSLYGIFRENNNRHFVSKFWENKEDYTNFIETNNVNYILECKKCNPPSNEKEFVVQFEKIWENDYYRLWKI